MAGSVTLTDDVGPVMGTVADGGLTDDARPVYAGTATSDINHVNIYDNGTLIGSTAVNADGSWSWTPDADLTDGAHDLTVSAVDAAGNEGPQTGGSADDGWSFTVDTETAVPGITANTDAELTGTAEPGAVVVVTDPTSGTVASTVADADGSWSLQPNPIDNDAQGVTVVATDEAGNSSTAVISGPADTTAPDNITSGIVAGSLTLTDDVGPVTGAIADGGLTDDARPVYAGTATSDINHVNIYDNGTLVGSTAVNADGSWSWTPDADLTDGAHEQTVSAVDAAGNEGPQTGGSADDGWSFTVDTETAVPGITANTDAELAGTAEPGATVTITDPSDGSETSVVADDQGNWSIRPNPIDNDAQGVTVVATDEAGNSSTAVISGPADTTAPDNITSGIVAGSVTLTDDVGPVTGAIADGGLTDDAQPTLAGTATSDIDHVNIYDNGTLIGSAAVNADGSWSWTPDADLTDGAHDLTVSAVDAAGNEGPQTGGSADDGWSFTVDTETAVPGITANTDAELTGTAEPGAVVVVTDPTGGTVASTVADADGSWSLQPNPGTEGAQDVTVVATDGAGNSSTAVISGPGDTTAPDNITSGIVAGSLTLTDDVGPVTGDIADGGLTDDARPVYAGTATSDINHVNIYDNGVLAGSAAVNADGSWSWTPTADLTDGAHDLTVSAVDAAGNEGPQTGGSADDGWSFTVDTETAVPGITANTDGELAGTAEPGATVTITDPSDGSETSVVADDQGNWSIRPNPIDNDAQGVTVVATDGAGNSSTAIISGPVDTTAPDNITSGIVAGSLTLTDDVGPVTGAIADGGLTDDAQPTLAGTATSDIDHVNIYDNGVLAGSTAVNADGSWSWTPDADLTDGAHDLTVSAVDAAGNEGPQTGGTADAGWSFTVDTETAVPGITANTDADLTGTAEPGAVVVVTDPTGGTVASTVADADGSWSLQPNPGTEGAQDVTVVATDGAGNSSTAVISGPGDTTAPDNITSGIVAGSVTLTDDVGPVTGDIADGGLTDDAQPTLAGTATSDINHVNIYDNGVLAGSTAVNADGSWSWTPDADLTDGAHDLTVSAVDAAGNEGPQTGGSANAGLSFTVDTETAVPGITANTDAELTGTAEPGATVTITDPSDGSETSVVADDQGNWSIRPNPIDNDAQGVTVVATDGAGNSSTAVISGPADTTAPDNITSGIVAGSLTLTDDVGPVTGAIADGGLTDDAQPTLAGTATSDINHVNIYDNGTMVGSTAVNADGSWSWTPDADLTDGAHELTVSAVDAAGNEGPQTGGTADAGWSFTVDTETAVPGITANTDAELTGTAEPGAVVVVTDPTGGTVASTVADADGSWSLQPNPIDNDAQGVTVVATDDAGNSSTAVISGPADTTAPDNITSGIVAGSLTLTDDVGPVTGAIADGGLTDDAQPTLAGTATSDINHVNIYDNGTMVGSTAVNADGSWSWTPDADLTDGAHDLTVSAVDAAGNEGPQTGGTANAGLSFTVDTETAVPGITANTDAELTGTAEPGAVVVVTDPTGGTVASTVADADGSWSLQPNPIDNDAQDVTVVATDEAGNSSTAVISGPGDTTAPDNITSGIVAGSVTLTDDVGPVTGDIADGGLTDDAQPTLAGTATSDINHVNIYDNGVLAGSTAVNADGSWSWTPDADLTDGAHDLTVSAVDAAGNEGPQTGGTADDGLSFTVDTQTPVPGITANTDAELAGTAEPGATVTITDPSDGSETSVVADDQGNWSIRPNPIDNDAQGVTVVATDGAGNSSTAVISGPADTTAPDNITSGIVAGSVTLTDDVGPVTGTVADGGLTDDARPVYAGTATSDIDHVNIYDNGTLIGSTAVNADGSWSWTPDADLTDGAHDLTVSAVDAAGNEGPQTGGSADAGWSFTVDTETAVPGITANTDAELTGTAEPGATVTITDPSDGSETSVVADDQGNWSIRPNPIDNDAQGVTVVATDGAGNSSTAVISGPADTTAPDNITSGIVAGSLTLTDDVGPVTGAIADGGLTDDARPVYAGTATSDINHVNIYDNGVLAGSTAVNADGSWSWTPDADLADGAHDLTVSAVDTAGNEGPQTSGTADDGWNFTLDTEGPDISIRSLQDDVGQVQFTSLVSGSVTNDTTPTFTGIAEAGALVSLYDNGVLLSTMTADAEGNWSYTPETELAEGTHSLSATASDEAGNVSTSNSWSYVIDTTAPAVGISKNSEESLSGTTEPGVTVIVVDGNGVKHSAVADEQGSWIIVPNPIVAGESGQVYAIDPAGNEGEPTSFQGSALASYNLLHESAVVNTTTVGNQLNPSTIRLSDGRIVVVWQGDGTSYSEVYMQLYEADGVTKIGTEQQVNQRTTSYQDSPQVVALADGGFLIVFESYINGLDNDGDGVMARRYNADGAAVTEEFQVNTTYSGQQNRPSAMATADGGYIITWESQATSIVQRSYDADDKPTSGEVTVATGTGMETTGGPEMAAFTDAAHSGMYITVWTQTGGPGDASYTGVVGQIFAADGTALGGNFQVNTTTDLEQNYPDVITLKDGSFVVFWDTDDSGATSSDIRAIHYQVDAVTGALTEVSNGDFIVNTYTKGKQYKPVGVALNDGGYLLIWGSDGGDGDGSAIYAQRYDASDSKVGREFLVNTVTAGNQGTGGDSIDATHILDAVLTADGSVYITWQSDNADGSGVGVEGVVVDVDAAYYSEYTLNTTTAGAQTQSSVASLPDGYAVVVWQSANGDGAGTCVMGQLVNAKGEPVGAEFVVNTTTAGDQITPEVAVLSDGTIQVVWSTGAGASIKGQAFTYTRDGAGEVTGLTESGAEYTVSTSSSGSQTNPVITPLHNGGYMVVWQEMVSGQWMVVGREYDAGGTPVTPETELANTGSVSAAPEVTTLTDGQVAISYTTGGTGNDAGVTIYNPSTHAMASHYVANQTLAGNQETPLVSALNNGNYVVTWTSSDNTGPDQSGTSVWGRVYAADGTALADEFIINTVTGGNQQQAKIVSREDGSFVAIFVSASDLAPGAGTYGIYLQAFDAEGHKVGQELQVNQLTYGDQVEVDATFLEGGQLYVTWTDKGVADGDGSAIKARLVDLVETLGLEQMTDNNDPTTISYQPATAAPASNTDVLPPNVGLSTNTKEALGGQTEAGAMVIVTDAEGNAYSAVADASGNWKIEPNPLSVGEHGTLYAVDAAGNQSEAAAISGSELDAYNLLHESAVVNTTTVGNQLNPSTIRLSDGRIVVVWQGDGTSYSEVYMQLYEADGVTKIGTEQQVNQRTTNNQDSPQVVALADGGFLIVFESYINGLDNDGDGVMARRYNADGAAVTEEFQVNTTYSGAQNRPSAMATADGGYIITWESQATSIVQRSYDADDNPTSGEVTVATGTGMETSGGPEMAAFTDAAHSGMYITVWTQNNGPGDTSGTGVVGQIFAADGTALGGNFQVNTTVVNDQHYPDVITLKDGSFVVFWDSNDSEATDYNIRAIHYQVDAVTGALTEVSNGDFIVNTYTKGKQYKPVGVALNDGGYLLIWGSDGGDGDGSAIYAQRYDASDSKVGREFLVNTVTAGNQGTGGDSIDATHILDAVLTADGSVYITWQSDNADGSGVGVEGVVVDVDAAYYSEYTLNTTTAGAQTQSSVASLPDGYAVVVWQSANGDGAGTCVMGQLVNAKGEPVGAEFVVNTTTAGDQITPEVAVLSDGTIQVVWSTGAGASIKGQAFTYTRDGAGEVTGLTESGAEYTVSTSSNGSQTNPVITPLHNGGYMVVWQEMVSGQWMVVGREYDAGGTPVTPETELANTGSVSAAPEVTTLTDGQVAISYTTGGTGNDAGVTIYNPSTHAMASHYVANQTLTGNQETPLVSALNNGNYVVTWTSSDNTGPDQSGTSVWGRVYAADGTALADEFIINTVTGGNQQQAKIVSREDGSFVAIFVSASDLAPGAGTYGIYAQSFDAEGHKVGQELQVNQLTYGDQVEVDATFLEGGQLYVTWTDKGVADGDGSAIKARLVDWDETVGLTSDSGATHIDYESSMHALNGTEGNDVLDARGADSVDAKGGDDTIVINSTNFTSINGGEGHNTLVWDSNNDFVIGSVSTKISGIENIHMGNNAGQTLVINASDVLEMTKGSDSEEHILHITGDVKASDSDSATSATDTVNINKSEWTVLTTQTENDVNYDVYVNNDDHTVKLLIQHGMNVI